MLAALFIVTVSSALMVYWSFETARLLRQAREQGDNPPRSGKGGRGLFLLAIRNLPQLSITH